MVLENVKEMWTEIPRISGGKKGRPVNKDRFISKMWVSLRLKDSGVTHSKDFTDTVCAGFYGGIQ